MEPESAAKRLTAYSFLVVFANDRSIDERELEMLKKLALSDGQIDEDEKAVLKGIFSRVSKPDLTEGVWKAIQEFRDEHEI